MIEEEEKEFIQPDATSENTQNESKASEKSSKKSASTSSKSKKSRSSRRRKVKTWTDEDLGKLSDKEKKLMK